MKRYSFIAALALIFCLAAAGCGVDWITYRSFIKGFYPKATKLYLYEVPSGYIAFRLHGDYYGMYTAGAEYDSLCTLYADMTYDKKFYEPDGNVDVLMHSTQIEAITVVSDRDFDTQHPSGTPLDDIVYLVSASPRKFILSGYRNTYNWKKGSGLSKHYDAVGYVSKLRFNRKDDSNNGFHPVQGHLNELSAADLLLLGDGKESNFMGYLAFDATPDDKGPHNITVTMKCDGTLFSETIKITFP